LDGEKLSVTGADPRPPKRRRTAAMAHFAGLDVSIEETAVCVVDEQGAVLMQCSVATEPEAIAKALAPFAATLKRAGHEAGALSPWLHPALLALGVPAVCMETRQVRAAMSAQRNKTDATDALGLAHLMRTGWFRQAHVKTDGAYRLKLLLTHRRNLKRKFLDLENAIRHSLKSFGVKLHKVGRAGFEQAVRDACAKDALTAELMDCMLTARGALWRQYLKLHDLVVKLVARDELCRRFMAIPGVGPVTALTFRTAIDDPSRFRRSRNVAAYFGLTSKRWQSGTSIDVQGRISKAGDPEVRRALYEAASAMLTRYKGQTALKAWGQKIAKRCHKKAVVAMARKLAVIMHAMWRDGTFYADRPNAEDASGAAPTAKERKLLGAHA
jgi:transposase